MAWDVLWKPYSDGGLNPGGLSVLLPTGQQYSYARIVDENGNTVADLRRSTAGQEHGVKFYSPQSGAAFGSNLTLEVGLPGGGSKTFNIPNGGQRYEGTFSGDGNLAESSKDSAGGYGGGGAGGSISAPPNSGSYPAGFAPGNIGFGAFPAYLGDLFPSPVLTDFDPIKPAKYKYVDPIKFGQQYGDFSRSEMAKNYGFASNLAQNTLANELRGLANFVPGASAIKRGQLAIDNRFNQAERTAQINSTLPEIRGQLDRQGERAETYASGHIPDSITDKALDIQTSSEATDLSAASGFGPRSVLSRKVSDLMSAEARVNLSKYGDQLLGTNVTQKVNTFLAPTSYSDAGQQVRVMPERGAGTLTSEVFGQANSLGITPASQAMGNVINQNQFKTNLNQRTNEFNASNLFNESNLNAGIQNAFSMDKFRYDVGYAGTLAGALQTNINTGVGIAQQQQYADIFQEYASKAQDAQQTQSMFQGIGGLITGLQSLYDKFFGDGSSDEGDVGGDGSVITDDYTPPYDTDENGDPILEPDYGDYDYTDDGVDASPNDVPDVFNDPAYGDSYDEGDDWSYDESWEDDYEVDTSSERALLRSKSGTGPSVSTGVTRAAGLSYTPKAGLASAGVDRSGNRVYTDPDLARSNDTTLGAQRLNTLVDIMEPVNAFNRKETSALGYIGNAASDLATIAGLTDLAKNGNKKKFINSLIKVLGPKAINKFVPPKYKIDPATGKKVRVNDDANAGLKLGLQGALLFSNWNNMSDGQRGLALMNFGLKASSFAGFDLAGKKIIDGAGTTPDLTVGGALSLMGRGYNAYGLIKNWDQLNDIQKLAGGLNTVSDIADTAEQFGLLGKGTSGAAAAGVNPLMLADQGWSAAPNLGVGAIVGGDTLPPGYSWVPTSDGTNVAIPTGNESTIAGTLGTAAGIASLAAGTYSLADRWGEGEGLKGLKPKPIEVGAVALLGPGLGGQSLPFLPGRRSGLANGIAGGSGMVAGLQSLGATNPYLAAAVMGVNIIGSVAKSGRHKDHGARVGYREGLKEAGFIDENYQVTLADGTKFNMDDDREDGMHEFTYADKASKGHEGRRLAAYDLDYTNDLDFAAGMGTVPLMRLLAGGKTITSDQLGNQLANASLGNIGYGQAFTKDNFEKMAKNIRAFYAKNGISNISDAFQLSNQLYADGKIDDTDLVTMQQGFNMYFGNNGYDLAKKLMAGRWRGIEVANEGTARSKKVNSNPKYAGDVNLKDTRKDVGKKSDVARLTSGRDENAAAFSGRNSKPVYYNNVKPGETGAIVNFNSKEEAKKYNASKFVTNDKNAKQKATVNYPGKEAETKGYNRVI